MTPKQLLQVEQSEKREALNKILNTPAEERTDEAKAEIATLSKRLQEIEPELRAAILAEPEDRWTVSTEDAETRALRRLREKVELRDHLAAAIEERQLDGAALEYNQALKIRGDHGFPLQLLSPQPEKRATTDSDGQSNQGAWLDRLFSTTAAQALGVSFRSVAPGVSSFPVTASGPTPAQRGRSEAAADGSWTTSVTELKPTRNAVRLVFSSEDELRLPGLSDALQRDLSAAMTEKIDRTIFLGDDGANENSADITGLTSASITERTLTQAEKIQGPATLSEFVSLVDGKHASSLADLRIVVSVGANSLWTTTVAAATVENQTLAQFLRASGMSWTVRGDIDTATSNGDFGGFIAGGRGLDGAAVVPVWEAASLIRDPYSSSASGEISLTLSYFWNFGIPRTSNFNRLKFVT